ncbi:hypothetical protein [Leptolyngbya ohadii]|uniref:hypothetical protein n=1 Tax=Leptolyngbya ohadii TaxID=1962290 RepID=UPI000B599CEA|nr:hypothetical protein [Leptolyngbya ohadii]
MNRKVPAPDNKEMPDQTGLVQQDEAAPSDATLADSALSDSTIMQPDSRDDLENILQDHPVLLSQLVSLPPEIKVALMHHWMNQLSQEQLHALVSFGQQQLTSVAESLPASVERQTRLVLKKDYSYQEQGLSQPTQYYVYLRRRKPKLDRYIGTLFYVPQGCTLSYKINAEGQVLFLPPHNLFQLKDSQNPLAVRLVRLLYLEPPPPDYTFTKQQHDSPHIHLHLEYLDPFTYQLQSRECYPFPFCMHEGGPLDRYRWDVSIASAVPSESEQVSGVSNHSSPRSTADSPRRVSEGLSDSAQFVLLNFAQSSLILERMQLWVTWSERAMPQSPWEIVQTNLPDAANQAASKTNQSGSTYTLVHSDSGRTILSYQPDRAIVYFSHSLPVVIKWFQDLGLAVSQTQDQRHYTAAQLKLAHSLFVNMSLAQTDPLVVLKQLFGVPFTKNSSD